MATTKKETEAISVLYTSNTIARFTHNNTDFVLENGGTYDLPADSETVQNLIKQNRLVLAPKK